MQENITFSNFVKLIYNGRKSNCDLLSETSVQKKIVIFNVKHSLAERE